MGATEIIVSLIDQASQGLSDIASNADAAFNDIASSSDAASTSMDAIESSAEEVSSAMDSVDASNLDTISSESETASGSLDDAAQSAEDLSNNVDEAGNSSSSLDAFSNLAIADIFSQGAASAQNFADKTSGLNTQIDQAGIRTGETSDQVRQYAIQVSDASLSTSEATAWIQRLGIAGITTGPQVTEVTDNMKILQRAMGLTGPETEKLVVGLKKVGVPLTDLPQSFNALGYMMEKSNISAGDLTNFLNKNAEALQTNHINVDQLALMYPALISKFGDAKKANAGFSQIMKDTGGDLSKVDKALGLQAGTLEHASDTTKQASGTLNELADAHEKNIPLSEQLSDLWQDANTQLGGIIGPAASVAGGLGQIGFAAFGLKGTWGAITSLREATNGMSLATAKNTIITGAQTIAEGARTVATNASSLATRALNLAMEANPIGIVIVLIMALVGVLIYLWETNEGFRNAVIGLWNAISGAVTTAGQSIWGALQFIWNGLTWLWSLLTGWVTNFTGTARNAGIGFVNSVINFFLQLPGKIWAVFLKGLLYVVTFGLRMGIYARNIGSTFVTNAITFLATLPLRAWGIFLSFLVKIGLLSPQAASKAMQVGTNIVNSIRDTLLNLPQNMYTWGMNALGKFVDGIENSIPGLKGALDMVSGLFPHSPPKEGPLSTITEANMTAFGSNLGNAFASGINSTTGDIFNNLTSLPSIPPTATLAAPITPSIDTRIITSDVATANNQYTLLKATSNNTLTDMAKSTKTNFNQMQNTMKTTMNDLVKNNKLSYSNIQNTTRNTLSDLKSQTTGSISSVKTSWIGMRDSLTDAASKIKSGVGTNINVLSGNIGTFYHRIRNPSLLVAGPRSNSKDQFKLLETAWQYPCYSPDGCYAGWSDITSPNTSSIKTTIGNYTPNFSPYGSLGLKASDFNSTNTPIRGSLSLFEQMAAQLIDPTSYEFYYNGRYTDSEALARGAFNCWDGAEILVDLAHALGLEAHMVHGHWGDTGHMGASVEGKIYDSTQRQQRGVWRGTSGVGFAGTPTIRDYSDFSANDSNTVTVKDEFNGTLTIKLENVPENIDENTIITALKSAITDSALIKKLVKNREFMDNLKIELAKGKGRKERAGG